MRARTNVDMASRVSRIQLGVRRLDSQPTAPGHSIAGIGGQIHDDLLDLARVGVHEAKSRVERRRQVDILSDQPP